SASGVTAAVISAQVAASGPMTSCLEVPKIAYATSGRMLEYKPTVGLNPANCAYATPTGKATAATERPATRSWDRLLRSYGRRPATPGATLESLAFQSFASDFAMGPKTVHLSIFRCPYPSRRR